MSKNAFIKKERCSVNKYFFKLFFEEVKGHLVKLAHYFQTNRVQEEESEFPCYSPKPVLQKCRKPVQLAK